MPKTASSELTARLVGEAVRRARADAGMTQAQLAEKLSVHSSYIAGLETGRRNVTIGQLGTIAMALGARLDVSLVLLDEEPLAIEPRITSEAGTAGGP